MWILQHKDFGLGNFTNLTPTIRSLSFINDTPIDVYFESDYVKEVYKNSQYINVLDKRPNTPPLLTSAKINKVIPDWEYVHNETIFIKPQMKIPHTHAPERKVVCVMNGCASEAKRDAKNPGYKTYNDLIEMIPEWYDIYFIGSKSDLNNNTRLKIDSGNFIINNIPLAQHLIRTCDFVLSNDTGWYHVAGAYGKLGFIMWKDTLFTKNKSPNLNFTYSFNNYAEEFKDFLVKKILI